MTKRFGAQCALGLVLGLAVSCAGRSISQGGSGGSDAAGSTATGGADVQCADGQMRYQTFRAQLFTRSKQGPCGTDADCSAISPANACATCLSDPVLASAAGEATAALNSEAEQDCALCPITPSPACLPVAVAVCSNGRCSVQSDK